MSPDQSWYLTETLTTVCTGFCPRSRKCRISQKTPVFRGQTFIRAGNLRRIKGTEERARGANHLYAQAIFDTDMSV